jgi:hypothetical protein
MVELNSIRIQVHLRNFPQALAPIYSSICPDTKSTDLNNNGAERRKRLSLISQGGKWS